MLEVLSAVFFCLFVFVLFYEIAAVGSELLALNLPGI